MKSLKAGSNFTLKKDIFCPDNGEGFSLTLKRKDIIKFNYFECTTITKEQEKKAFDEFVKEGRFEKLRIIPLSRRCLEVLFKRHTIILITARPERIKKDTELWLRKRKIPHNKLVFSESKYLDCRNFDIIIEDKWENVFDIAKKGIKVILLDYPWNRECIEQENIIRVKTWKEILGLFENKKLNLK